MHSHSRALACASLLIAFSVAATPDGTAQIVQAQMNSVGPTPAFPQGRAIRFASDIASIGDVDNDSITDLAVADAGYHASQASGPFNIGAVHIFSGAGIPATRLVSAFGAAQIDYFGWALAVLDDLNADGRPELAAGAPQAGVGNGFVRIIDTTTGANVVGPIVGPVAMGWFGHGLAAINDLNADGFRDLVVLGLNTVQIRSGLTGAALTGVAATINNFSTVFTHPGAVAVEDVNGDGFQDIVIGAPNLDQVDVIDGSLGGFGTVLTSSFGTTGTLYGFSVAACGDQDGDGANDIAIGAPGADQVELRTARVGLPLISTRTVAAGGTYGTSVSGLGPNAFGAPIELLIGAPNNAPATGFAEVVGPGGLVYALSSTPAAMGFGSRVIDAGVGANAFNRTAVATGQGFSGVAFVGSVRIFFGAPAALGTLRGTGCGPLGPALLFPVGSTFLGNAGFQFLNISPQIGTPGLIGILAMGFPSAPIPVTPGCFAFFNPTGSASVVFTYTGVDLLPFPIPANPALAGQTFTAQTGVFGGPSLELSNGVDIFLGY